MLLHIGFLALIAVLGPMVWAYAHLQVKPLRPVQLRWALPPFMGVTIVLFVLSLSLLVLFWFFVAQSWGRLQVPHIQPGFGLLLAGYSLLGIGALACLYSGLQLLLCVYVTNQGLAFFDWSWRQPLPRLRAVRWAQVSDYYLQHDFPATFFNFLVLNEADALDRYRFRVPVHMLGRFEALLQSRLEQQRRLRAEARQVSGPLMPN